MQMSRDLPKKDCPSNKKTSIREDLPIRTNKEKGRWKDYQRKIKSSFDMPLKTELTKDKIHNQTKLKPQMDTLKI